MTVPATTPDAFTRLLDALAHHGHPARGNDQQRTARCPAHDDNQPSLSITRGRDRVLLHCHAGCGTDEILEQLAMSAADLYDHPIDPHTNGDATRTNGSRILETYDYADEGGELLYQVVRLEPKTFRQRRPNGDGGWVWRLGSTRRVLYHLPAVQTAVRAGQVVYVVEGEKDVHAAERAGATATCNPGGAGKWRPEYAEHLRGAHVVIVADRDDPGRSHARDVATSLTGTANQVVVVEPAEGKDLADHLAAGHTLDELVTRPHLELVDSQDTTAPASPTGIGYISFHDLFTKPREPIHWHASPIIAAGRVTTIYSPGKTGKSLIAMEAAAAIATGMPILGSIAADPVHVLYVDQEMTPEDWHERLEDMGYTADDAHLLDQRLHLAQLQSWPAMDTHLGGAALLAEVQRHDAQVVIIDTASKVVSGEENSNDTHAAFYRCTLIPLKRAGCGVLVLDHTGKDLDRGARGGSAKTDNVDLAFELLTRGKNLLSLRCSHARFRDPALDEPAFIRREEDPLHHVLEEYRAPVMTPGGTIRPTHLMERVSRYVEATPGATRNSIETAVKGKKDYVRLAMELLVGEGYIHAESGPRRSVSYTQITPFREDEERPE